MNLKVKLQCSLFESILTLNWWKVSFTISQYLIFINVIVIYFKMTFDEIVDILTFNIHTISYLAALRSEFEMILTFETFFILKTVPFIFSNVTMTFIFANILKRRICCGLLILVFIAIQAKYPPSVYCFLIQMSESSTMNVSHYVQ